jgi:hypothetical protein
MHFGIDTANKITSIQQRECEVAILALLRGSVTLNGVLKAPELLRIVSLTDDIVKWAEELDWDMFNVLSRRLLELTEVLLENEISVLQRGDRDLFDFSGAHKLF